MRNVQSNSSPTPEQFSKRIKSAQTSTALSLYSFGSLSASGFALFVTAFSANAADPQIPKLKLQPEITVSGLSSGGYMANQLHMAHSTQIKGAAIIAAGPYGCAQNSLSIALDHCFNKATSAPDLAIADTQMQQLASAGKIDDLKNLAGAKVWLLHGSKDTTVHAAVSDALTKQYQQLGATVSYVNDKPFAHHYPIAGKGGNDCAVSDAPFLGSCDFDSTGQFLTHLLGKVEQKAATTTGSLVKFNQQEVAGDVADGMGDEGFVYIPTSCAKGESCRLHISFHGCKQNADAVGDAYPRLSGLNEYADTNHLVVLYPQTKKSAMAPFNPNACWDWWGYTNGDYATKQGLQIQAVMNMAAWLRK